MENQVQDLNENEQIEKKVKDTSKYVNPIVSWLLIFISLATAFLIGMLVIYA